MTTHFSISELCHSQTALDRGIDNEAPEDVIPHLEALMAALEDVRTLLNAPLHINSGYRCPELNMAVRGVPHSAHVEGWAADFTCPQFGTPKQIVFEIKASGIKFDQCIQEGTWVHLSIDPQMRQRVLTAHFNAAGVATYTNGVG